jgi:hypothetical protein
MRNPVLLFLSVFTTRYFFAQNEEISVKKLVQTLFVAMKKAYASMLANTFSDSAILQTIINDKNDIVKVRNEHLKDFIDFVSKEGKRTADERISFETIKIDGPLAFVWTPYKSFIKENLVIVVLIHFNWTMEIQYLSDTRRKAGCE